MSNYGDLLGSSLSDEDYDLDVAALKRLVGSIDQDDNATLDKILAKAGSSAEDFADVFSEQAKYVKIDGTALYEVEGFDNSQLARLLVDPPDNIFGPEEGIADRNKLLLKLVINQIDTDTIGITPAVIISQNPDLVESIVINSAEQIPFWSTYLQAWLFGGSLTLYGDLEDIVPSAAETAEQLNDNLNEALDGTPEPELDETQTREAEDISDAEAKQCILLNLLQPLNEYYDTAYLQKQLDFSKISLPYGGKIVKLNCNPVSHFMNYLTSVGGVTDNYTTKDSSIWGKLTETVNDVRLSFIKTGPNGNLIELPIVDTMVAKNKAPPDPTAPPPAEEDETTIPVGGFSTFDTTTGASGRARAKSFEEAGDTIESQGGTDEYKEGVQANAWDVVKNCSFEYDISYAGTNPSTSRNDVDVTISIKTSNINAFSQSWSYSYDSSIIYSLFDLVLFPFYEKDADGYGKIYRSQFSPNYNRIRLCYRSKLSEDAGGDIPAEEWNAANEWFKKNSNVLDLTLIDHEFTRNGEDDMYELKITYKGYVQSLLTTPQSDALSDSAIKAVRAGREKIIQKATEKGCSVTELNKIIGSLNEAAQGDIVDISGKILSTLFKRYEANRKGLGVFALASSALHENLKDGDSIDLEKVKKHIVTNTEILSPGAQADVEKRALMPYADIDTVLGDTSAIYYFYIADLLDVILEHSDLFTNKGGISTSMPRLKQELKFILGSFNYTDANSKTYNINVGHIPISLDYFKEWFQETVTDKDLFIYPCLSFIRDLFETVVTNLLSQVCFKTTEQQNHIVRTSFFTGTKPKGVVNNNDSILDYYSDKIFSTHDVDKGEYKTVVHMDKNDRTKFPIVKNDFDSTIEDYNNYCIIYVQGPASVGKQASSEFVPEFYINNNEVLGEQSFSFNRTQQTGLREARYFRNSSSGITMLASVYNTSIDLQVPLCFLYPGNFYKVQMSGNDFKRPTIRQSTNGEEKFIFEELGLDGYYVITKSSFKISGPQNNPVAATSIQGLWVSSDDPYWNIRISNSPADTLITDPTYLTKRDDCNILLQLGEEVSTLSGMGRTFDSYYTDTEIDRALSAENQVQAAAELTGELSIVGYGTQVEREGLLAAGKEGGKRGSLSLPDGKLVLYKSIKNEDGTISIVDKSASGTSQNNIIGVFRNDENGQTFSENPAYFDEVD